MTRPRPSIFVLIAVVLLGGGMIGGVTLPTPAQAAQTVSAKVGKPLQEAQALAKAGNYNGAIAKAKEAQAITPRTAYEDFVINDFLAYVYTSKKDYKNAITAYEAALKSAPAAEKGKRIKTLAQLSYQIRDYGKTITYANRYLKEIGPDASLQLLVANCYYQQRSYQQALTSSKAIIDSADSAGRAPSKAALALYLSSAYQLKDSASVKRALFRLVELYPTDGYWTALIKQVSGQGLSDYTSLDLRRLQLRLNLFKTGDEYFNMAKLAFALNLPGDAKVILEQGFQKKLLGSAPGERDQRLQKVVIEAAAKDLAGLQATDAAAAAGTSGDADILAGQKYASFGQYDKAITAINRGLARKTNGVVANPDQAKLELGRVLLQAGKTESGRKVLQSIKTEGGTRDVARLYLIAG